MTHSISSSYVFICELDPLEVELFFFKNMRIYLSRESLTVTSTLIVIFTATSIDHSFAYFTTCINACAIDLNMSDHDEKNVARQIC